MSIKPFKKSKPSGKVSDKKPVSKMIQNKNILFQYSVSDWRNIPIDQVNMLNKMYKDYNMRSRK